MDKKENDSLELRVLKRMIKSKESYTYAAILNLIAEESFNDCADGLVHVDKFSYVEGFQKGYSYKEKSLKTIEEADSE